MTQQELADSLGVGRRTVQAWEAGERPIPLNQQARISALLARRESNPLDAYPSVELLAEVLRRLDPVKDSNAIGALAGLIGHLGDSK
jgi:transcriptional regulator with XRE-family HTH domain